jgi:hypothetical protein
VNALTSENLLSGSGGDLNVKAGMVGESPFQPGFQSCWVCGPPDLLLDLSRLHEEPSSGSRQEGLSHHQINRRTKDNEHQREDSAMPKRQAPANAQDLHEQSLNA